MAASYDTPAGTHLVFISHRGVGMKLGFASHLYSALKTSGIDAFLDMEELSIGSDARKDMLGKVKEASIQVPIFTEDFGTSEWCLEELALMMESKRDRGAKVFPIYFNLEPEALRKETFLQSCPSGDDKIRRWKYSLEEASWLEGFRLKTYGGSEGRLIEALVEKINDEIYDLAPYVRDGVGLDAKVQEVVMRLCLQEGMRVYVVLIWGMGGVGKTTLAKAIYHHCRKDFEVACFVQNCGDLAEIEIQGLLVRALLRCKSYTADDIYQGRFRLQYGLKHKRALIILDDVNSSSLLENVLNVKKLCPGSRILLTSRNITVLAPEEDFSTSRNITILPPEEDFSADVRCERYELELMCDLEALQLLCLHAFRSFHPKQGFVDVAKEVVKACGGLPLSLEVLGRYLRTLKEEKLWREAIEKLLDSKCKEITDRLMISYEALDDDEQQMFQDVACFLIGKSERTAKFFWHASVKGCEIGLQKLRELCLVKVDGRNCLAMHNHLRDLGRDISRKNKSRIWNDVDLQQLLTEKKGLEMIRGVATSLSFMNVSDIAHMTSLQLLFLGGTKLQGARSSKLQNLKIKWLYWEKCPHKTLPKGLFTEIAVLQLRNLKGKLPFTLSQAKRSWEVGISKRERLESLPELASLKCLEMLQACKSKLIPKPPSSLGKLEWLRELDISGCGQLEGLPEVGSLECLEVLRACELKLIRKLPSLGQLKKLRKLDISGCGRLEELSEDVGSLECLEVLRARELKLITKLPSLGQLKKLRELDISECGRLEELSEDVGSLECLEVLRACKLKLISKLPSSLGQLRKLKELDISWCWRVEQLPEDVGSLKCLEVLRTIELKLITKLPSSLGQLKKLRELDISRCERLEMLPEDLGSLDCLAVLRVAELKLVKKLPSSIGQLKMLRELDIFGLKFVGELDIFGLKMVRKVAIIGLNMVRELEFLLPTLGGDRGRHRVISGCSSYIRIWKLKPSLNHMCTHTRQCCLLIKK